MKPLIIIGFLVALVVVVSAQQGSQMVRITNGCADPNGLCNCKKFCKQFNGKGKCRSNGLSGCQGFCAWNDYTGFRDDCVCYCDNGNLRTVPDSQTDNPPYSGVDTACFSNVCAILEPCYSNLAYKTVDQACNKLCQSLRSGCDAYGFCAGTYKRNCMCYFPKSQKEGRYSPNCNYNSSCNAYDKRAGRDDNYDGVDDNRDKGEIHTHDDSNQRYPSDTVFSDDREHGDDCDDNGRNNGNGKNNGNDWDNSNPWDNNNGRNNGNGKNQGDRDNQYGRH